MKQEFGQIFGRVASDAVIGQVQHLDRARGQYLDQTWGAFVGEKVVWEPQLLDAAQIPQTVVNGVEFVIVHSGVSHANPFESAAGSKAHGQHVAVLDGHAEHVPAEVHAALLHLVTHSELLLVRDGHGSGLMPGRGASSWEFVAYGGQKIFTMVGGQIWSFSSFGEFL